MILFWLNDGGFSKPHSHLFRLLARQLSSCVLFVVGCFFIQYSDLSSFFSSKTPLRHAGLTWMLLFFTTVNSFEFLMNETSSHFENTSLKNINVIYNTVCIAIVYF